MKKVLLSLALIFIFGAYAFYSRTQSNSSHVATTIIPTATANDSSVSNSGLKDGVYTGDRTDAFYGFIQVKATIQNGKIADVVFLEYPNDQGNSQSINEDAIPKLENEAIMAQSSVVDTVSGATQTSDAFKQSLASALSRAKS